MLAERRSGSALIAKLADHSIELVRFAWIAVVGHQLIGAHWRFETRNREFPVGYSEQCLEIRNAEGLTQG